MEEAANYPVMIMQDALTEYIDFNNPHLRMSTNYTDSNEAVEPIMPAHLDEANLEIINPVPRTSKSADPIILSAGNETPRTSTSPTSFEYLLLSSLEKIPQ